MLLCVALPLRVDVDGFVAVQPYVSAMMWALLLVTTLTSGTPRGMKRFLLVISVETVLILVTFSTMVPIAP